MAEIVVTPVPHLTSTLLEVNALLDAGQRCELDEVTEKVKDGSLFDWLRLKGVETLQFTGDERAELLALFAALDAEVHERRKFGVEHNGYALLVAWLVEALQQRLAAEGLYPV